MGRQVLIMGPATALVWVAGLWHLLRHPTWRALGLGWLALLAVMMALNGKHYYMAGAYPMLFAAGGVWWEGRSRSLQRLVAALVLVTGVLLAPMALPVLPVETFLRYQDAIGIKPPATEYSHNGVLPQNYGDMFGWPEMVEKTAAVFHSLPAEERAKAGIFANNYGQAAAIDFFGPRHELPKAISADIGYWVWGPRDYTGEVLVVLGDERADAEQWCASVEERDAVGHPYGMPYERFNILVCRGLKKPPREIWGLLKKW
jgi:hypothetical protein